MRIPASAIVIFGATGDLAKRKLAPAFWNLFREGYLSADSVIVACGRRAYSDEALREEFAQALEEFSRLKPAAAPELAAEFLGRVRYHQSELDDAEGYARLSRLLDTIDAERTDGAGPLPRLYYLAVAPEHFARTAEMLGEANLAREDGHGTPRRIVIEKPHGTDLESSRELMRRVRAHWQESQIFRIDHYLGKETVQNILSFRFGNTVFEPLFNHRYIDHVQITVAETVGMEGRRGQYYDTAGTLRDMVQNHMMQLLCLVAMEPPSSLRADAVRNEKVKVLDSLRPLLGEDLDQRAVRGQYGPSNGTKGYREELGVNPASTTETYAAIRVAIDNWRWSGVPFVLRSGKRLPKKVTEIAVQFKRPPLHFFGTTDGGDTCDISQLRPNVLVFRIQPTEGIGLTVAHKKTGPSMTLESVELDFSKDGERLSNTPEAYERLLLDALRGDGVLFTRADEVEASWGYFQPLLDHWRDKQPTVPFPNYAAGTWGPEAAKALLVRTAGTWRV